MKTNLLILFLLISFTAKSSCQSRHLLFAKTGYTFNNTIKINDNKIEDSWGVPLTLGFTYRIFNRAKIHSELGFAAHWIFASGEVDDVSFNAQTLRLGIPLNVTCDLKENWEAVLGLFLQNNQDRKSFDLRLRDKYSYRLNLTGEVRHTLASKWQVSGGFYLNLREMPDVFFINDPKFSINIGILKRILLLKRKKKRK